jgi:hypothetical protein
MLLSIQIPFADMRRFKFEAGRSLADPLGRGPLPENSFDALGEYVRGHGEGSNFGGKTASATPEEELGFLKFHHL